MSQGRLIVACDFGTSSFRALVTEVRENGDLEVVGSACEKTEGFRDGDFVDMVSGSRCIARTMRQLEKNSDIYVSGFTYNISGSHLRSVRAMAQVPIGPGPRPIRESDIAVAREKARGMTIPFDHKILTVNPIEYSVDRVRGIVDPRGRVGSQLEVQAHLITGSRSVLNNVENAIETAKYTPLGDAVDILSTGMALLTQPDKEEGVLLIDVGGLVTNWAVYRKGSITANGILPWGGDHLTADLSHGLRICTDDAESVKRQRGITLRSMVEEASIEDLFEEESPTETPGLVAAILEPRMEEIFVLVKREFSDQRELAELGAGIVLTGGGSLCQGTAQLCEEIFDLPVSRRNSSPRLRGVDKLVEGNWTTVIGLSLWAAGDAPLLDENTGIDGDGGFLNRLKGVFRRGKNGEDEMVANG